VEAGFSCGFCAIIFIDTLTKATKISVNLVDVWIVYRNRNLPSMEHGKFTYQYQIWSVSNNR